MPKLPTTAPTRTLFSADEASEYLGIRPQTLANWRSTGRVIIPFLRVGRLVKYRKSALDEYLANQEREHT